jgi:hypothetical protein
MKKENEKKRNLYNQLQKMSLIYKSFLTPSISNHIRFICILWNPTPISFSNY